MTSKSAIWPLAIDPELEVAQTFQRWFFLWNAVTDIGVERFRKMLDDLQAKLEERVGGPEDGPNRKAGASAPSGVVVSSSSGPTTRAPRLTRADRDRIYREGGWAAVLAATRRPHICEEFNPACRRCTAAARRQRILNAVEGGASMADVAKDEGVTPKRIYQIVKAERESSRERKPT